MSTDDTASGPFSLRRWSRRKLAAARAAPEAVVAQDIAPAPNLPQPAGAALPVAEPVVEPADLPPIESLTIDSDFTAFLQPRVAETVKRQALKQLFRDPRFNVMDGLDVYIDDYSQPDPISPEVVRELMQARYIFAPPQTRVNEHGAIEDVPAADAAPAPDAADPVALPDSGSADSSIAQANVNASVTPLVDVSSLPPRQPDPAPR
jgi:hypothetical protein